MSKLIMMALAVCMLVATSASAGTVTIPAGAIASTNIMVVPPVINPTASALAAIPDRTATNAVKLGELRKQDSTIIVCAWPGTTATTMVTTTNIIGAITNVVVKAAPITIPNAGLSAADGTAYWMKVPRVRNNMIVKVTVGDANVTLSTPDGGVLPVAQTTVYGTEFTGLTKALYATQSNSTNVNSVSVMEW